MNTALDAALLVFRERGYNAASLDELGSAMNLTVGSIYKAFSDKRAIFLAAFDRYTNRRSAELNRRLETEASGLGKLRAMLGFYADSSYGSEGRRGCLVVGGATELTLFDPEMAGRVTASMKRIRAKLHDLIKAGQLDGSIRSDIDPEASASLILCLVQGLRVVGKTGRTRTEMMAVVDQAIRLLG